MSSDDSVRTHADQGRDLGATTRTSGLSDPFVDLSDLCRLERRCILGQLGRRLPMARPISMITCEPIDNEGRPNLDGLSDDGIVLAKQAARQHASARSSESAGSAA